MIRSHYAKLYKYQTINGETYSMMGIETNSIKFDTRIGRWSAIDFRTGYFHNGNNACIALFALFENDYYGDMTDYVLAYYDCYSTDERWREIEGTFDDIETALIDNECIDC